MNDVGVTIFVSEPWSFGTECGVGPFCGQVECEADDTLQIKLFDAIVYNNRTYSMVIAAKRHESKPNATIKENMPLAVGLEFVSSSSSSAANEHRRDQNILAIGSISFDRPIIW